MKFTKSLELSIFLKFLILTLFNINVSTYAQTHKIDRKWWFPNGKVNSVVYDSVHNRVYLGGGFSKVGPHRVGGVSFDTLGAPNLQGDQINGAVRKSIPDGNGGKFIAGDFTKVGEKTKHSIAQIDANGKVTSLFGSKGFYGSIRDIKRKGDSLFVGGTLIGYGLNKRNFVICDTGTMQMDSTSLNVTSSLAGGSYGILNAIVTDGNNGWIVAGRFNRVGKRKRINLAHIQSNGELSSLRFEFNEEVTSLYLDGGYLYVGGFFDRVNGKSTGHLIRINMNTNTLDSWSPDLNGVVFTIGKHGGNIIIGGIFSQVGNFTRSNLAAISINNGVATSWNPSPDGRVNCMEIFGNDIVIGGDFQNIGFNNRPYIAKVGLTNGILSGWNANSNGIVNCVYKDGNDLYVGGDFTHIGGQPRNRAACISYGWGVANSWDPEFNDAVLDLTVVNNKVIAGGEFTTMGTSSWGGVLEDVKYVAAVDKVTGLRVNFNVYSSYHVNCIAKNGNKLAIGGQISSFNETEVGGVAVLSTLTGELLNWNSSVDDRVNAMEIINDTLFVAGNMQYSSLIALDVHTGTQFNWNSSIFHQLYCLQAFGNDLIYGGDGTVGVSKIRRSSLVKTRLSETNGKVYDIAIDGNQLFLGGSFTTVSGNVSRNNLAKINTGTHVVSSWDPDVNGEISTLTVYKDKVLIGGSFSQVGTANVDNLTAVDSVTAVYNSWTPNPNYQILSIEKYGDSLFVGGGFTSIGQIECNNFCSLNSITGEVSNSTVNSNGEIYEMQLLDSTLLIRGSYSNIGGAFRPKLAMLNTNSHTISSWSPNPNGIVTTIAMDSFYVYVGGLFTNIGGNSNKRLAKVSRNTGASVAWQPFGSSGFPYCSSLAVKNDSLFVGGGYSTIGGQPRNNLSVINKNTGVPFNWIANTNGPVSVLEMIDSNIYIGGSFTTVSGLGKKTGAKLRISDATVETWNRDTLPTTIYGLAKANNLLYEVGSVPRLFSGLVPSISSYDLQTESQSDWKPILRGAFVRDVITFQNQVAFAGEINTIDDNRVSNFFVMDPCYYSRVDTVYACSSYLWMDGNVYDSNNYSARYVKENTNGCDSVITLHLTMKNNSSIDIHNVCDSLVWIDGITRFSNDSISTFTLTNSFGCDSVVQLNLQILNDSVIDVQNACDSLIWIDGNTYYSSNDSAFSVLLNTNGCDSIVYLNLEILPDSTIDYHVNCDSLTWLNGVTYHHSIDSVFWVTSNQYGCDSTVQLHYQNNGQLIVDSIQVCDSLTWINGITYYENSSGEFVTFTNTNGCDSVIFLELEILSDSTIDYHSNCDSLTWLNGVTYYQSTDSVFWTIPNIHGCDSTIQLNYQMNRNGSVDIVSACDSLTWVDGNTYYNSTDSVSLVLTNSHGCDSLVQLDLTINSTQWRDDSITVCDSLVWINGQTYYSSNYSATHILSNPNGCDTNVFLYLTVEPIDTSLSVHLNTISANALGASFQWMECVNGVKNIIPGETQSSFTASESGSYSVEITKNGCIDTTNCVTLDNVGIKENSLNAEFTVFPNPTDGLVRITFEKEMRALKLTVYSVDGKVVNSVSKSVSKEFEIEINGAPGKYILELETEIGLRTSRVIIKE